MSDKIQKLRDALGLNVEDVILEEYGSQVENNGIGLNNETHNTYIKIDGKWFHLMTSEWGEFTREDPPDWLLEKAESRKK